VHLFSGSISFTAHIFLTTNIVLQISRAYSQSIFFYKGEWLSRSSPQSELSKYARSCRHCIDGLSWEPRFQSKVCVSRGWRLCHLLLGTVQFVSGSKRRKLQLGIVGRPASSFCAMFGWYSYNTYIIPRRYLGRYLVQRTLLLHCNPL
jgi:hypothetical protein